ALQSAMGGTLAALRIAGGRHVRFTVSPALVPELAAILRQTFGADLWVMMADDRRRTAGRYEVHYLFAHPRENWFVDATAPVGAEGSAFPFWEVGGRGVFEVPGGPVHAGVIEPGHFRFSVVGETIIDMKPRLYFTHKGTEKLFEGRLPADGVALAERVSGDSTIGHALAYCQAIESAARVEAPRRARYLRVILLELERIYNHIADVGA